MLGSTQDPKVCGASQLAFTPMSAHLSFNKNSKELRLTQQINWQILAIGEIISELYQICLKQYKTLLPEVTFLTEEATEEHMTRLLQMLGALTHRTAPAQPRFTAWSFSVTKL